jgi:hypothetical protein
MATIPPDRARPAPADDAAAAPPPARGRPAGVTGLAVFFGLGAVLAAVAAVSLATPGGFLEPMWRLNPIARRGLRGFELPGAALLGAVSLACAGAASGLWRGARWGRRLALAVLAVQLLGESPTWRSASTAARSSGSRSPPP